MFPPRRLEGPAQLWKYGMFFLNLPPSTFFLSKASCQTFSLFYWCPFHRSSFCFVIATRDMVCFRASIFFCWKLLQVGPKLIDIRMERAATVGVVRGLATKKHPTRVVSINLVRIAN